MTPKVNWPNVPRTQANRILRQRSPFSNSYNYQDRGDHLLFTWSDNDVRDGEKGGDDTNLTTNEDWGENKRKTAGCDNKYNPY